jgi:hypothetical protein
MFECNVASLWDEGIEDARDRRDGGNENYVAETMTEHYGEVGSNRNHKIWNHCLDMRQKMNQHAWDAYEPDTFDLPLLFTYEMDPSDDVGQGDMTGICHWIRLLVQPSRLPWGNERLNGSLNEMRSMGWTIQKKRQRHLGRDCLPTWIVNDEIWIKRRGGCCDLPLFICVTRPPIRTCDGTTTLSKVPLPITETAWYFRRFACFAFCFRGWLKTFDLLETTAKLD